jgi:hypothetical protein
VSVDEAKKAHSSAGSNIRDTIFRILNVVGYIVSVSTG